MRTATAQPDVRLALRTSREDVVVSARIYWSDATKRAGLFDGLETIDPAWVGTTESGWSLRCTFASAPRVQGSPSDCQVEFVVPNAPHHALVSGARLELFERTTGERAIVEIR